MANIGTSIKNWSTTEASNQPDTTDANTIVGDLRAIQSGVRYLRSNDTIASASTCDLGSKDAEYLSISGTTTITALGTVSTGIVKRVAFEGALTLTHNGTSLILPGAANITTAAGDTAEFVSLGSGNWRCTNYQKSGGVGLIPANNLSDVSSASTARTNLGLAIGTDVQAYDADTLKADVADVLVAGFATTPYNAGTKSTGTFTPDEANGNMQYAVNGGAHTLAPPTNNCSLVIQYTNNGSAGTITTSGFTKVTGSTPTTTNGYDFLAYVTKINGFSHLNWVALQ